MVKKKAEKINRKCRFIKMHDEWECDIFNDSNDCWYSSYYECREALRKRNTQ